MFILNSYNVFSMFIIYKHRHIFYLKILFKLLFYFKKLRKVIIENNSTDIGKIIINDTKVTTNIVNDIKTTIVEYYFKFKISYNFYLKKFFTFTINNY